MERVTVVTEIENGKTLFREVVKELPLFEQTADLTETLGQYPCTISVNSKVGEQERPMTKNEETPLCSPDGIIYG